MIHIYCFFLTCTDELAPTPEALDLEDKITPTDKVLVEEMVSALREEVKEMDRTKWLYEAQDPEVTMRVKV
jgi:hypothetical protein